VEQLPFHIQLLGGFRIACGENPISGISTSRLQSLLAYLVLNANIAQPRQNVAFLLWPNTSEANARNNLRQYLHQLRHLLPDADRLIASDANTIYWVKDEHQFVDVEQFELSLAEAEAAEQRSDLGAEQRWLEGALSLYRGDLLPGFYDDWISADRERLRQECQHAYQKLARALEELRDYAAALQAAQALVRLDPLDENTYVTLIRLHDLNRDLPAARRVYQNAADTLQRELGVEPGRLLQQAYERAMRPHEIHLSERRAAPLTLVGRKLEWQQLQAAWQHATSEKAQFTLITGEAGIGKSRLAEEFYTWASKHGFMTARARSYAAEGRLSLAPVIEWLRSSTLRPFLNTLDKVWLTEVARLLPELFSEYKDLAHPAPIGEYGQRQHFFEGLARAILAAPLPTLLWIDDLQWCDPETLEWLHFLLRFKPHSPLMVLGTARSEESLPDHPLVGLAQQLQGEGKFISIALSPLDAAETAQLAHQVEGRELEIPTALRLFRETEGNPLFIVETLRSGAGMGADDPETAAPQLDLGASKLPPRVYGVIAGRLAQLSPIARRLTELGAAIGREFTLDVLLLAGQEDEANTITALDELWQKRILREQSANLFDFTHDKLREIAYAEISAPRRRMLHRQIAQALEALNAEWLDKVSAQIAAQYEQAALFEQAIPYFQRAGEFAAGLYANEDAIGLYERGLSLLLKLPPSVKRDTQELILQLALATLYRLSKGWASPEEERVINRAMILSEKVGTTDQRIRTLFGMQLLYVVQARYEKVEQTFSQAERLYLQTHHTPSPPFAGISLAGARSLMGHMTEARELFDKIVAVRDDKHILDLQASQGLNYLVHGHAWNAHVIWCLGYPQMALDVARNAIDLAHEFAQPFNQALAMTYMALLQAWCADVGTLLSHAKDAFDYANTCKAPYYRTWANILVCYAHAQAQQQPDSQSIAMLQDAIRAFTDTGAHVRLPVYFALLAHACQRAGQIDRGLEAIELGMNESLQNSERWWDSELHRLRGELIWSQGADVEEIEEAFRRSLEIAQSQKAKSLELRAATSLGQFWKATGRATAAKRLLAPLYAWFSEGLDTPDLKNTRLFIEKL
jgi:DNA-binding SARP family transcriptional activator